MDELPREARASRELEERVVEDLKRSGWISAEGAATRRSWRRRLPALAASILLVSAGFLAGLAAGRRPLVAEDATPRYLLLLHEPAGGVVAPGDSAVEEYRAWAVRQASQGHLLAGEKLKNGGALLHSAPGKEAAAQEARGADAEYIGGYFLVRAGSLEEAVRIARTCPHLARGGTIEVRQIDPT